MDNLSITTININGFRSKQKQDYVKEFIKQNHVDILCIQETFIDNYFLSNKIDNDLNLQKCIWSYGTGHSKGVCIMVCNPNINILKFHTDFDGRVAYIDFTLNNEINYRLINIYTPTNTVDRNEFFTSIIPHLVVAKNLILTGDFNFIFKPKLDKIGGNENFGTSGSKIFQNIINTHKLIDTYRHLYPQTRNVTWMRKTSLNNFNYKYIGSRLDRFYINKHFIDALRDTYNLPCTHSDHDFVVLKLNIDIGLTYGKSYWKFNDSLLDDNDFVESFQYYWEIISRVENKDLTYWDKMKLEIKNFCIEYSQMINKSKYNTYRKLKKDFRNLNNNNKNTNNLQIQEEIKNKIKLIETEMQNGTLIRSKANLLDTKENPSSFFFNKEKQHSLKKTVTLINHDSHTYTKSNDILNCFREFYKNLYTEEPIDKNINETFLNNLPQVGSLDNNRLCQPISKDEIYEVLCKMESGKSPGSDGLTPGFYKKFFHILGDELENVIQLTYDMGEMSDSQKMSYTLGKKSPAHLGCLGY